MSGTGPTPNGTCLMLKWGDNLNFCRKNMPETAGQLSVPIRDMRKLVLNSKVCKDLQKKQQPDFAFLKMYPIEFPFK